MVASYPSRHESVLTVLPLQPSNIPPLWCSAPPLSLANHGAFCGRPRLLCTHSQPQPISHCSPLRGCQPQSSPQVSPLKPSAGIQYLASTSPLASQASDHMKPLCWFLSILSATKWLLCSPLSLQSAPSVPADLPPGEGASPLLLLPPWGAGPIPISFFFSFSPMQFHEDFPCSSARTRSSVRIR